MNDEELAEKYNSGASVSELMRQSGFGRNKIMNSFLRTGTKLRNNASARVPVELGPQEVPENVRGEFNFNNQYVDGVGKGRRGLVIERNCTHCSNIYSVPVAQIRGDLGRGRTMRAGKCPNCRGRILSSEGYVFILKPDHPRAYNGKYVPEHILVMETHLGRYLDTNIESVHHIDGDKLNNDINNLQLRTRYHGKGQTWQCKDCGSHNVEAVQL